MLRFRLPKYQAFALLIAVVGYATLIASLLASGDLRAGHLVVWALLLTLPLLSRATGLSGGQVVVSGPIPLFAMLLTLGPASTMLGAGVAVLVGHLVRSTEPERKEPLSFGQEARGRVLGADKSRSDTASRLDPWRTGFNVGQTVLGIFVAAIALRVGLPRGEVMPLLQSHGSPGALLGALLLASLAYLLVQTVLVSTVIALESEQRFQDLWRSNHRWLIPQCFWVPIGAFVLASLYTHHLWLPFAIVYAFCLCEVRIAQAILRLKALFDQSIDSLTAILLKAAPHLEDESERIRSISLELARRLRLSPLQRQVIEKAVPLLNVGYVGLERGMFLKEGELDESERAKLELHPGYGERIVGKLHHLGHVARVVRAHHERMDGRGYPDQLKGSAVPIEVRVVGAADAYVAMTSHRPHRERMTKEDALWMMAGEGYDPKVLRELAALEEADLPRELLEEAKRRIPEESLGVKVGFRIRRIGEVVIGRITAKGLVGEGFRARASHLALFFVPPAVFFMAAVRWAEPGIDLGPQTAFWLTAVAVSAFLTTFLRRGATLTAAFGTLAASVLLLEPVVAILLGVLAGTIVGARELARARLPASALAVPLATAAAVCVYHTLCGGAPPEEPTAWLPGVLSALTLGLVAVGSSVTLEGLERRLSPVRVATGSFGSILPESVLYVLTGIAAAVMFRILGIVGGLATLTYPLFRLHNAVWQKGELERSYAELLAAMAQAIDEKDSYTRGHSQRVSGNPRIAIRAA